MKKLSHSFKINLLLAAIAVGLVAAAVLLNALAVVLGGRYPLSADLTANASYQISRETKDVLSSLSGEVDVYVLSTEGGFSGSKYFEQAKRVIDQYPRFSQNVRLRYVDTAADPTFTASYPDLTLAAGDVIVQSGETYKRIPVNNLFHYTYQSDGSLAISSSRAEEALSSAIVSVTSGETVKVAVLTGNGVTDAAAFTALLADNNYTLEAASLASGSLISYDAALLFAPETDLSEDAVRMLEDFLYNNGDYGKTLFYTAAAGQPALPNLDTFLAEWGVAYGDGAVFETTQERTYQFQPFYPTAVYADGQYTDMLRDKNTPFLMSVARPMEVLFGQKDGHTVTELLSFSETSGVRPPEAGNEFKADDATQRGPFPALVLASYTARGATGGADVHSQIIASSSTAMFEELALQNTSLANSEYLLNLLNTLSERTDAVQIPPKSLEGKTLGATSAQVTALGVVLVGLVPLAILASGLAVWLARRYR